MIAKLGCVFLLAATSALPASYFVSSTRGRDNNDGRSPRRAWQTLARVTQQPLRPGDVVHLERGGVWRESLKAAASGTPRGLIRITAYGAGPPPVITGVNIGIDNNEQSHIVYENLEIRDVFQGLRLFSWNRPVTDVTLQNTVVFTRPAERGVKISAGVYASTHARTLANIVILNNRFVPHATGLENWGVYFAKGVTNFRIENNVFGPAGEDAITIWHCWRGIIRHNRGGGNGENTIDVKDSREISIQDNIAANDAEYNIVIHAVDFPAETHHITVRGNLCVGGGQGGVLTAGIALLRTRDSELLENRVERSTGEGILVVNSDPEAHNEVRRNRLQDNGVRRRTSPIVVQGAPGTRIADNIVQP